MMNFGALKNEGGSKRYLIHELPLCIISGRCRVGFVLKIPNRCKVFQRQPLLRYCTNLISGKNMQSFMHNIVFRGHILV